MTPKPGIQTTEFWLSAFTTVVSLLAVLGIPNTLDDAQIRMLAAAAAIIVPAVYSLARTLLKLRASRNPNGPVTGNKSSRLVRHPPGFPTI